MLPLLYHAHHSLYKEDIGFWLDLASRQSGPVLELGCGTGRVLIPLAQSGHAVVGLDRDAEMLALLKSYLSLALRQQVMIIQADFTRFHLGQLFGLILMPCNTYSTLAVVERQAVLACVRKHLSPDGTFAVSLPNPDWLRGLAASSPVELEEVFPHPLDGEPVQVSSAWRRTKREFILDWFYDHLMPDGTVERYTTRLRHDLTPAVQYLEEFRLAGFARVQSFGGFERPAFSAESPEWVILAE
jgi:SAM-dependent methyltransferase